MILFKPSFVCLNPIIRLYPDFLTGEECDALIDLAVPTLSRSTVLSGDKTTFAEVHGGRTSSSMCFARGHNALLRRVEHRLAILTQSPIENGEGIQVLQYEPGQHYLPHHDYFDPDVEGYVKYMERGGQRVYSVLMYLNDDFMEGETEFPMLNLKILPARGSVLVFANIDAEGKPNPQTMHGGCPPKGGIKYVATKWIRQRVY